MSDIVMRQRPEWEVCLPIRRDPVPPAARPREAPQARDGRLAGAWAGGERCGFGRCEYANGDVHEGQFRLGKKHGRGRCKLASGDVYEGDYEEDMSE